MEVDACRRKEAPDGLVSVGTLVLTGREEGWLTLLWEIDLRKALGADFAEKAPACR